MTSHMLKLNDVKTEVLVKTSRYHVKLKFPPLRVGNTDVQINTSAHNIGVIFDKKMSFKSHIRKITSQAFYHIRNISKIRKYLSQASTVSVVHARITSKLDFCNSLLYGLPGTPMLKELAAS